MLEKSCSIRSSCSKVLGVKCRTVFKLRKRRRKSKVQCLSLWLNSCYFNSISRGCWTLYNQVQLTEQLVSQKLWRLIIQPKFSSLTFLRQQVNLSWTHTFYSKQIYRVWWFNSGTTWGQASLTLYLFYWLVYGIVRYYIMDIFPGDVATSLSGR